MASVYERSRDKDKKGSRWYVGYGDERGQYRSKCSGTTDKATAERIANKLEADAQLRAEGVIDASVDRINQQSRRPVTEHIGDYERRLQVAGRSDQHVRETIVYIRAYAVDSGDQSQPAERLRREQSDFLAEVNDAGEAFVFHSFRHTTGSWLALQGQHPKTVQVVMRHKSITLTLDTYGHLFPGQAAEAESGLAAVMAPVMPQLLAATGTEAENWQCIGSAQDAIQCAEGATACDEVAQPATLKIAKSPEKTGASCDPVRSATIPCAPPAPLAQLAEQLTLNQ